MYPVLYVPIMTTVCMTVASVQMIVGSENFST